MGRSSVSDYSRHIAIESLITSPLDRTPSYYKYLMSAYLYYEARLAVPGRAYDTDDLGMLALGGSAHVDLLDLEVWLASADDRTRSEALTWALDASPEQVSYWRGLGRGHSPRNVRRERESMAEQAAAGIGAEIGVQG
jgi:hypothetical protein